MADRTNKENSAGNDAQRLRALSDRLDMLGEFSQIIASGAPLERMAQKLVQQLAFRFYCDAALMLILSEDGSHFEVKASFGCQKEILPERIEVMDSLMGRALRLGGLMSVPDLAAQSEHGLDFLRQAGLSCIHTCSLEAKSETLGAVLIGYRKQRFLEEAEITLFEEFARGAAAAVGTAKSQARLTAYAEKLEELVQRRTADLERQKEVAEEANRAKSRFVANMSHELRTPLTAVIGYASVLADGVFGEINDKQKDALQSISRSSEHLKELIDEVLNLSRIEAGKEDPEPSRVELYSLLQQTYKLMLQTAVGKGISLSPLDVKDEIKTLKLWVDPRHIRQILMNLMSNAIKYTPSGGVVRASAEVVGDKVKISVLDNGVGISKDLIDRLFLRFERGDDQYSRTQSGTGIGLSLTKHLIEINGGRIGVESDEGKGSDFWVLIPLADVSALSEEAGTEQTVHERFARLDGLNILIVDDNEMTCKVLKEIVEASGGASFVAPSVREAKRLTESVQFDAALVDLAMPVESGLVLIDYFRRECPEPLSQIPILVISACVFEDDEREAMSRGASAFIPKPFKPKDVALCIRALTTSAFLNGGGSLLASHSPKTS